ncbi:LacI family DNA-binding transcriptional regulator [Arthrobacter castelli]|uniref:LacI family DNA-binding transcriptional regulator n=1 Tax=Arthrobacter castelli TaxID=271431 RepID=UPI0003F5D14F|nr:LacI family DNA-binding transcriptional regulator [Arthrobacter castelli]
MLNSGVRQAVTRKDVARYAGVSTAVVSYVVNARPKKVAPATEARVREAIKLLGYQPNGAARALKLGSTEMLGLVIPDSSNPFFAELSHALENSANELGYAVLLTNSNGSIDKERKHVQSLSSRGVDGLLLASIEPQPDLERFKESGVPTVLLNRHEPLPGLASIGVDLVQGARTAVDHLISHDHTDIDLVMGTSPVASVDGREKGWRQALTEARLTEGTVHRAAFSRRGGYEAGQRLITARKPPTAVFASSDTQAAGVLRALHEAGLQVPQDIALISFDASSESEYTWPALTAVRQPIHAMAAAAIETLLRRESAGENEHTVFPTDLLIRRSCGCAPSASNDVFLPTSATKT